MSPDYYCMDGTIPRRHLAKVLAAIEQMEDEYNLRCANVFHAGDGNLHPLIMFDSNKPDEVERAEKFGAAILELRSEEHTSELQSLMRISYAVLCLKKKTIKTKNISTPQT